VLWNNALVSATVLKTFAQAFADGSWWGRLVENAVGAHLLNGLHGSAWGVTYWRDATEEVDFVVSQGTRDLGHRGEKRSRRQSQRDDGIRKRYPRPRSGWSGQPGSIWRNSSPVRPPSGFSEARLVFFLLARVEDTGSGWRTPYLVPRPWRTRLERIEDRSQFCAGTGAVPFMRGSSNSRLRRGVVTVRRTVRKR